MSNGTKKTTESKRKQLNCDCSADFKSRVSKHAKRLEITESAYIRSTLAKDMDEYDYKIKGTH